MLHRSMRRHTLLLPQMSFQRRTVAFSVLQSFGVSENSTALARLAHESHESDELSKARTMCPQASMLVDPVLQL